MCISDGDFSQLSMKDEDIKYIQYSYLNLSKYIYLPFLYGYDMNSVTNCKIYSKVEKHLTKVRCREIDTVSDIHKIVEAVSKLAEIYEHLRNIRFYIFEQKGRWVCVTISVRHRWYDSKEIMK